MKQLPNEVKPSRAFLEHFPANRRSAVMNAFLAQVRGGVTDPQMIVARVCSEAIVKSMMRGSAEERTKYHGLTLAMEDYPQEAEALAAYCLWWESLSPGKRSRLKTAAGDHHRAEWTRRQPATQKQVMFLRQLGHQGPVADRQAASAEIARRLAGTRQ